MDVFPAPKFVERVLTPRASEVLVARLWFGRLFSWTVALSNDELVESSLSGLRGRRRGVTRSCAVALRLVHAPTSSVGELRPAPSPNVASFGRSWSARIARARALRRRRSCAHPQHGMPAGISARFLLGITTRGRALPRKFHACRGTRGNDASSLTGLGRFCWRWRAHTSVFSLAPSVSTAGVLSAGSCKPAPLRREYENPDRTSSTTGGRRMLQA